MIAGAIWLGKLLPSIVVSVLDGRLNDAGDWIIGLFFFPLILSPGLIAIYSGWKLWRNPDHAAIRRATGLVAIVGAFYLAMMTDRYLREVLPESGSLLIAKRMRPSRTYPTTNPG